MRKYLVAIIAVILLAILGITVVKVSHSAVEDLKEPWLEPSSLAQAQTKVFPVRSTGNAKPGMYWSQLDSGKFTATSTLSGYTAVADNGGDDYNPYPTGSPKTKFNAVLDLDAYLPESGFEDSNGNKYSNLEVRTNGFYALYVDAIVFDSTSGYNQTAGTSAKLVDGTSSTLDFWVDTGGPGWDDVEQIVVNGVKAYRIVDGVQTDYPKMTVLYDMPMVLEWRGEVRQEAEIKIEGPSTIKLGTSETYGSYVRKTGYQAVDWTSIENRQNVTIYTSSDPDILSIDRTTGVATANEKGVVTVTVEWYEPEDMGYMLTTSMEVTVGDDTITEDNGSNGNSGSGSSSGSGSGGIIFTPNDTSAMEAPYVRGWARSDFTVQASVSGYQPVVTSTTVTGTKRVPYSCGTAEVPATCYNTVTANIPYTATWEADISNITITGDASGTNSVVISKEGDSLQLHGKVEYTTLTEVWNPGEYTATKPTAPAKPSAIEGSSGIYKLDKQVPEQVVYPVSQGWTNEPIEVNIKHTDNLSGFYNTGYELTNISYYADGGLTGTAPTSALTWNPVLTIAQQGVYTLKTWLGDYAGWPEVGSTGSQEYMYTDYRYDNVSPYTTQFAVGTGGVVKDSTFDYITDTSNTVKVRVGDDLSGIASAQFSWSKSPERSDPSVNGYGAGWNSLPLTTTEYATGANQYSSYIDININSKTQYNQYQATSYDDEKEGTWYLHIRQYDRAGNMTHSVSPPIFINKLKNLRVYKISDFAWKNYFLTTSNVPTLLTIDGIQTNEMPIYYNKEHRNVSLGYGADYKFDVVGFNGTNDRIEIQIDYHSVDQNGGLYKYDDVYVETSTGDFIPLEDSEYSAQGDLVTFSHTINEDKKLLYEDSVSPNASSRGMWLEDTNQTAYSTMAHRLFLPPTTKFVKNGQPLDLVNGTGEVKYKELVTFTIKAYREGHTQPLEYTLREDQWANPSMWGGTDYNSYGKNRPSGTSVLGLGTNKGEVIWFDLQKTLNDDLKYFREW